LPASHASTENVVGLLGLALMLTAMMAPLLIPALRHVHARSLRSRRWRAVSLVTVAHAAVWTVGGIVLLAVASALRSVTGHAHLAVLLGLVTALTWQLSPLKQYCLNRHCAHPPISSFGAAAVGDAPISAACTPRGAWGHVGR
jgi:predicted metal-binding membrane protein